MRKFIIGIDVDDTLMPYIPILLDLYQQKYGEKIEPNEVTSWGFDNFQKEVRDRFWGIMAGNEIQDRQYPWSDALWLLQELHQRGHEIVFASAVTPEHMDARADQIRRFFLPLGEADIMLGNRKDLLECDFLLDDCSANIQNSHAKHGCLLRKPWNKNTPKGEDIHVVNDYKEFLDLVDHYANETEKRIACLIGPPSSGKESIAKALELDGNYEKRGWRELVDEPFDGNAVTIVDCIEEAARLRRVYKDAIQVFYVFRTGIVPSWTEIGIADAVISNTETITDAANAVRHFMR